MPRMTYLYFFPSSLIVVSFKTVIFKYLKLLPGAKGFFKVALHSLRFFRALSINVRISLEGIVVLVGGLFMHREEKTTNNARAKLKIKVIFFIVYSPYPLYYFKFYIPSGVA